MKPHTRSIIIGAAAALITAGIIIYSIEEQKSFWQILAGFSLFVIPFTFISGFGSKIGSFVFVFFLTLITYFISKFVLHDFWLGVLLAGIIGGSAFFFRVRTYKPFNPEEYKQKAKQ